MSISRRDTLILAMLINIALLSILFATANYWQDKKDIPVAAKEVVKNETKLIGQEKPIIAAAPKKDGNKLPVDELDQVLKNYAVSNGRQTTADSEVVNPSSHISDTAQPSSPATSSTDVSTSMSHAQYSSPSYYEIIVKRGDSLDKIAKANGVSIDEIVKANRLLSQQLRVGQVLKVPVTSSSAQKIAGTSKGQPNIKSTANQTSYASSSTANKKKSSDGDKEYYTIRKGDNPWKIARQFHVKFEDLLEMNQLNEERAKNLQVGDQIRVR